MYEQGQDALWMTDTKRILYMPACYHLSLCLSHTPACHTISFSASLHGSCLHTCLPAFYALCLHVCLYLNRLYLPYTCYIIYCLNILSPHGNGTRTDGTGPRWTLGGTGLIVCMGWACLSTASSPFSPQWLPYFLLLLPFLSNFDFLLFLLPILLPPPPCVVPIRTQQSSKKRPYLLRRLKLTRLPRLATTRRCCWRC